MSQAPSYKISSKEQGAPFDLVVTEISREPNKSYLSVPGFHHRTAPGARWLMCVYTDLAVKRGFSYWNVMYPTRDKEVLVVAFANAESSPRELFGHDFDGKRVLGEQMAPVAKFTRFCGLRR